MKYRNMVLSIAFLAVISLLIQTAWLIIVDPINIWGSPIIKGVNQNKFKQGVFLDICKVYEYARVKPELLFIGASRIYVGFRPSLKGYDDSKVYNMGLSSLSIRDMRKYLEYVYKVHKPKEIWVGLDFTQFSKGNYNLKRTGFSDNRLTFAGLSLPSRYVMAWQDSMGISEWALETMKKSHSEPDIYSNFLNGWDIKRGTATEPDKKTYYYYINSHTRAYKEWEYEPEAMNDLKELVREAALNDVEMKLFFVPDSVDLNLMRDITGHGEDFKAIKKEIADLKPVYDFNYINELTEGRSKYYYDAGHYRSVLGERIKEAMLLDSDSTYSFLLDKDNVDYKLKKEEEQCEAWKNENKEYINLLVDAFNKQKVFKEGDLQEFIGF